MRKSKQRKLEKKRRLERKKRRQQPVSQAYHGNKYLNDKLLPFLFQTEIGIYESFVMSGREITDHDVRRELERLIQEVRGGKGFPSSSALACGPAVQESGESLIAMNIRRRWEDYREEEPFPGSGPLIGVLRTILGSVETWGNISPTSRGYLRYLEGFMNKAGVNCRQIEPEIGKRLLDGDEEIDLDALGEDEDDELLEAGRAWTSGDKSAGIVFRSLAEEMIEDGEGQEVSEICQQVLGLNPPKHVREELMKLSLGAQQRLPPPRSRLKRWLRTLIGG